MIKKHILLSVALLSTLVIANTISAGKNNIDQLSDLVSMTLRSEELDMMDRNPNESYVYVSDDVRESLRAMSEDIKCSDCLSELRKYTEIYSSAPYELTCRAMEEAIKYYKSCDQERRCNIEILEKYREHLESGAALIIKEENVTRKRNKCKRFCRLIVECLRAKILCVDNNAAVGGNLNVRGNITFNNRTLNAKGGVEALLRNIRGSLQFGALTVTLPGTGTGAVAFSNSGVSVVRGAGFTAGPLTGVALNLTGTLAGAIPAGSFFIVALVDINVTFDTPFATPPTVIPGLEVGTINLAVPGYINTAIPAVTNVTNNGFTLRLIFSSVGTSIANIGVLLSNVIANNRVNFIAEAPVAAA